MATLQELALTAEAPLLSDDRAQDAITRTKEISEASKAGPDTANRKERSRSEASPLSVLIMVLVMILVFLSVAIVIFWVILHHGKPTSYPSTSQVGLHAYSGTRSISDIVTTCLSTLLICVVSAFHFDILSTHPVLKHGEKHTWWAITFLAPEIAVKLAAQELVGAYEDVAKMRGEGHPGWTLRLAFFAQSGGFELRDGTVIKSGKELLATASRHSLLAQLDLESLESEVLDRSKADTVGKLLTIVQVCRFLMGIVARARSSLPISPLEYVTCTYVVCTLIMYACWIKKPYGVQRRVCLDRQLTCETQAAQTPHRTSLCWKPGFVMKYGSTLLLLATGLVLGGGHLASWNTQFSNSNEIILWRTCSIAVTGLSTLIAFVSSPLVPSSRGQAWCCVFLVPYLLARIWLLSLLGLSFSSLPVATYSTHGTGWLNLVPFFH